jgi:hypothetical protein
MRLFPEWRREQRRQGRTWGTNESYRARGRRRMGNSQDAWRLIDRNGAFNQAGGNATLFKLEEHGITGNGHFMNEDRNNGDIAKLMIEWIESVEK